MLVPSSPRKLTFVSPAGRFPGLLSSGKWFFSAFLSKLVQLSGGTTFSLNLPPPPPSVEGRRAPGLSSPTPGEHTDRVVFDPFLRWGSGSECAFASAPFCLPRVPFSGGRAQRVSGRVEQESTRSGVVVFFLFFRSPLKSAGFVSAAEPREERIVSWLPQTRPEPHFSQGTSALPWAVPFSVGERVWEHLWANLCPGFVIFPNQLRRVHR